MVDMKKVDSYLDAHLDESIAELSKLVAQPSISAKQLGLGECAEMTAEMLRSRGFRVEIAPTGGAPVVFAERKGKSERTILFYNHYDVQPEEPVELWTSPAFAPEIRNGKLYGRGVGDDKGHFVGRLFAIDALLDQCGELPCTVKFLLEGEEEVSSGHLHPYVEQNVEKLKADVCIWEFGAVDSRDVPIQYLGLRGICYVELSVETASQDVHSGIGGSIFPNAAWRLVWALNTLKDEKEHIRIPGFYDKVRRPSERDIELLAALPDHGPEYKEQYGLAGFLNGLTGGLELSVAEVFQPTCTICGLNSGYQGAGSKTVLPAKASAKIDFRLVPDQRPEEVLRLLRAHLDREGFEDVKVTFLGGEAPARTDPDDPFVNLAVEIAREPYGVPMQIVPMTGGSGPNAIVQDALHIPILTAGIIDPFSGSHAPDENIRLDLYLKGAKHIARILQAIGEMK